MTPAEPQSQALVRAGQARAEGAKDRLAALVGLGLAAWASTCSRATERVRSEAEPVAPHHAPATAESANDRAPAPLVEVVEASHTTVQAKPDAPSPDVASGPGLRAAFCAAVESCSSIEPWLQLAELALASLAEDKPVPDSSGRWTYAVEWPHSDDRVEVTSTIGLPDDAHVVQIRVELARASQPAECPVALDGLLQIFLRWQEDVLVECTVMTQLDVPQSAELDEWIERASAADQGSRRKGAFVQCYSKTPSVRRTIELRLERTPEGPVRESRFVDAPPCECSTKAASSDVLRNLCRAVRQSHR